MRGKESVSYPESVKSERAGSAEEPHGGPGTAHHQPERGLAGTQTQLLYFANPRMLLFAVGISYNGAQPPVIANEYATFPMP